MTTYVTYLIEANFGLIVLLLFYQLFLRQETQFSFKRAYLLIGISASLLFPLIKIQTALSAIPSIGKVISTYFLPELVITSGDSGPASFIDYWTLTKWVYVAVSLLLLLVLVIKLSRIFLYLRKAKSTRYSDKFEIIESTSNLPTFSFFQFIFLGNISSLSPDEKNQVIKHEITHASKFHSLDILLVEILKVIFWFNPAVYYFKSLFTSIHEFQADQLAADYRDVDQYCNLLARVALQSADYPIANHFNNSLTLKRIAMLKTAKTKIKAWKIAILTPLALGLFLFIACQEQLPNDEVLTIVDEPASPVEGMTAFYKNLATNIHYPEQARKLGVEGKVFVEFVIDKDGSIGEVKALKGIGAGCDNEAVRVVREFAKWNPAKQKGKKVKQRLVLPVTFTLGGTNKNMEETEIDNPTMSEMVVVGQAPKKKN